MNAFTVVKAIETAACGRKSIQNAQHFVPLILHSQFSTLHSPFHSKKRPPFSKSLGDAFILCLKGLSFSDLVAGLPLCPDGAGAADGSAYGSAGGAGQVGVKALVQQQAVSLKA